MNVVEKQIIKTLKKGNYKNIEVIAEVEKDGIEKGWQKYKPSGRKIIIHQDTALYASLRR